MRACFLSQNVCALGNGIAVLKSAWSEAEPPRVADKTKPKEQSAAGTKPDKVESEK
jgi:hypothetical protein